MMIILTYLAQKDLSGGATTSTSPFSPIVSSSVKTGVLHLQNTTVKTKRMSGLELYVQIGQNIGI